MTAFSGQKRSFPLLSGSFWMLLMAVLVLSQGAAAILPPPPSWGWWWWKCRMITKLPEDHQDNSRFNSRFVTGCHYWNPMGWSFFLCVIFFLANINRVEGKEHPLNTQRLQGCSWLAGCSGAASSCPFFFCRISIWAENFFLGS